MFDAVEFLVKEAKNENIINLEKERFSFSWLAQKVIDRQKVGKDCIIIITGDRRGGKSNWMLKLILRYIELRKNEDKEFTWSWKTNFPHSRAKAEEYASTLPNKSFIVYDEAGDFYYRQDTNKKAQRDLIKFMNKSGVKLHLTVLVWPDLYTLDPKLLNMAHLLVIVPYRAGNVCSFGFIYGRSNNPLNYDKFGIEKVRKHFSSKSASIKAQLPTMSGTMNINDDGKDVEIKYPEDLFNSLKGMPTFLKMHRFNPVEAEFEKAYIKNVKNKALMAHKEEDEYVSAIEFNRVRNQYRTLLYNLHSRGDMSLAQIERLHMDKWGNLIRRIPAIKRDIESIRVTEKPGKMMDTEEEDAIPG